MNRLLRTTVLTFIPFIFLLSIGLTVLNGCGSMQLGHPLMGASEGYPRHYDISLDELKSFQLSRLQDGYSLLLFSFQIVGETSGPLSEKIVLASGLRVWQHRFKEGDLDTITKRGLIPLFMESDRIPLSNIDLVWWLKAKSRYDRRFLAQYTGPEIDMTYHKGRIAYGGRIVIDATTASEPCRIEYHFEKDVIPILDLLKAKPPDLEVVISPISKVIPPKNDNWNE